MAKNNVANDISTDTGQRNAYDHDLPRRQVLSVCEHFSWRPLITFDCLNLVPEGGRSRIDFDRFFAQYASADPSDSSLDNESYDLIICDHCYQEFEDAGVLAEQIYQLLKEGGFCYLSGQSRLAQGKPRISGRGRYMSLEALRRTFGNFWIHDYVPLILENPVVFERTEPATGGLSSLVPGGVRRSVYARLTEFVWVLTKKK